MPEETFDSQLPEDPFDPEEIEEIANDVLGEMDPEEIEGFFRKLEQDAVNDDLRGWKMMYGFDHECSCAADAEAEKMVSITECYAGACEQAFEELARARQFLFAIATSPSQQTSTLKRLAEEGFFGAR